MTLHFERGRKIFKFNFELNPNEPSKVQAAKMRLAFDKAVTKFFGDRQPASLPNEGPDRY